MAEMTPLATEAQMAQALRFLAMDAVEQAKSGHPGMPMGMADVATVLFNRFMNVDPADPVWERKGRFHDAQRPGVEPEGLDSPESVLAHRARHLAAVRQVFTGCDVFVFTLGLTEEDHAEVLTGVSEGDVIVSVGVENLKDGQPVTVLQ